MCINFIDTQMRFVQVVLNPNTIGSGCLKWLADTFVYNYS